MSLQRTNPFKRLSFRLTLLYSAVCSLSLIGVMLVAYVSLSSQLHAEMDEHLANEIEEYGALLREQNLEVLRDVLQQEASSEGVDRIFFRVLSSDGGIVQETDMSAWADATIHKPSVLAALEGRTVLETLDGTQRAYPARIAYGRFTPELVLQVGMSTADSERVLHRFRRIFLTASVLFIGFSVVVGSWLAGRATKGVQNVTRTVQRIIEGEWDSRVELSGRRDEIDDLAKAFNELVDRLQVLVRELREVTDDIAHDLRTPLTRIRAAAEHLLVRSESGAAARESAGSVVEECDHLLVLINTMLEISQTEAGARTIRPEPLDLSALAEDVVELFRPAAEDKRLRCQFEAQPGLMVDGEQQKIRQIIAQLLDNAIKYTPEGGLIQVACVRERDAARVSIEDNGVGIAPENHEKIFLRFFRADESRTAGGNGLGLSLARVLARAHGGDILVRSGAGGGSTFTLCLPLRPA